MDHYKPFKQQFESNDYRDFRIWFQLANENGHGVLFLEEAENYVGMMSKIAETCMAAGQNETELDFSKFRNIFIGVFEIL